MQTTIPMIEAREFRRTREEKLKKELINLLRDDGKGHHHAKYAERLEYFDIQIVPLRADPNFTAAVSFDKAIIYIGEGFLTDPDTFYQLNVLIRHELAHSLLMHQVRMAYKLGEVEHMHCSVSEQLHKLHNIIADDELSNRIYSEEDKIIVRNMILNGRIIGGLVTEDHRGDWVNMTLEEMYDKLCEEMDKIHANILGGRSLKRLAIENSEDVVTRNLINTFIYSDVDGTSMFEMPIDDFIKNGCSFGAKKKLRTDFAEIVKAIYNKLNETEYDDTSIKALLDKVAKSSPLKKLDVFDDGSVVLYTPEEKYIAVEVLKKFKSAYTEWYDKVMSSLGSLSPAELKELLDTIA